MLAMGVKQLADPLKLGDRLLPRLNFHFVGGVMGSGHRRRDRSDLVLRSSGASGWGDR
jgi:hypothetical protein